MLIKECHSVNGNCPCLSCPKDCKGCIAGAPEGYAADTDKLCEKAKKYCEEAEAKANGND